MKRYLEAVFLFFMVLAVSYSSELWFLGVPCVGFIAYYLRAHLKNRTPVYLKSVTYGMIVPFFFWWFLSPSNGSVFSPWLLIIPSWYFTFLALWQWRSEGRGGFQVFVIWNAIFVLLLSLRTADRMQFTLIGLSLLFFALSVKPPRRNVRFVLTLLLAVALGGLFVFGFQKAYEWRSNKTRSGEWEEKYRNERSMMGFSTVAALGGFSSNYVSEKNSQIVLRLWTLKPPKFLRAVAYKDYSGGIWNMSREEEWLQPDRYIGDYAVFASTDSLDDAVWVQASLNTFEFAFAPPGSGVAFKAADSIVYKPGSIFKTPAENHDDWYYIQKKEATAADSLDLDSAALKMFLSEPQRLKEFFDSVAVVIGVKRGMAAREATAKINSYLGSHFRYELALPFVHGRKTTGEDPLVSFWNYKAGFCEYFASFETLLLRHIGIPARYVTGFAWPSVAPSGDYVVFRRSNSHAWVEVFDKGWQISDPTPPAPPGMFDFEFSRSDRFSEIFKSKMLYYMHVLRDGEWRRALDSWSNVIENVLASVWLKIVLGTALVILLSLYGYKRFERARKNRVTSERILKFEKMLRRAESILARFGFVRLPGETEFAFLQRVSQVALPEKPAARKKFCDALELLAAYDKERWK